MKTQYALMMIIALGVTCQSAVAADKQRKIQYKCHFELIGGEQVIHYMGSAATNASTVSKQMQGKTIYAKNGISKKHIYKVIECVDASATFKAVASQKLDERTLT